MEKNSKILVTGHKGLVGSSIVRVLESQGYENVLTADRVRFDLKNIDDVESVFMKYEPEYVFNAAAKVGGIHANNTSPAEFINDNLQIQTNVINACRNYQIKKLCFLGSVCIYPKYASVPVKEEYLLTGELEPTNQWYAVAKIAGIKLCQAFRKQYGSDFISVMPCNLYGVNDNFHPFNSHVIPALIRKFVEAMERGEKTVMCWGTGTARREFMYVDDMADACIFLMNNYSDESIINIGFGKDYTIKELTEMIAEIVGFNGQIVWDTSKPDGTPKRLMESSRLFNLGWRPKISLRDGLTKSVAWFKYNR